MIEERNYWLGFSAFSGVGPIRFRKLLAQFGSAKDAWSAKQTDLEKILGIALIEKFDRFRNKFSVSDYVNQVERKGVSFVLLTDKEYPKLLFQIKNPPFLLYVKGDKEILRLPFGGLRVAQDDNVKTIAVVGTRKTIQYGREVTKLLTQELVAAGFTIVSGLAMGIDAISHKTAIENNGKTIAVLGCGVDCCYPKENQSIYNSIIARSGCIVSEYPLSQLPTKGSFPSRNRIIAGVSMGVLVTEGAEDSGSLITADYARKFGRPVFAVPGPITSGMSKGPYKLISRGAKLVTSANDILKELNFSSGFRIKNLELRIKKGDTEEEQKILDILQNEALSFDEIVRRTGFSPSKIGSLLSLMEVKGMIKSLESGFFSIAS